MLLMLLISTSVVFAQSKASKAQRKAEKKKELEKKKVARAEEKARKRHMSIQNKKKSARETFRRE